MKQYIKKHAYKDMQLGKISDYTFTSNESIYGLFSYGDKEGLTWGDLKPLNPGNTPRFASKQEALDEYFKEEYKKGFKDRIICK